MKSKSAKAIADVLIEYPRVKNLCFWGTQASDSAIEAVTKILKHKSAFRWSKASSLLHVEILGNCSRQFTTTFCEPLMTSILTKAPNASTKADNFSPERLAAFNSSLLYTTTVLQVLILDGQTLGDSGLAAISSGLYNLTTLKKLGLSYTGLTSASGPLLGQLIAGRNTCHFHSHTQHNAPIQNPDVADLNVSKFSESFLGPIPHQAGEISSTNPLVPLATPTVNMPQLNLLESIMLEGNYLGMGGLANIGAGLQSPFTTIKHLNLAGNEINALLEPADTAAAIHHHQALDSFFKGLVASRMITDIDMRRNSIGSEAMRILMPALQTNTNIKTFRTSARLDRDIVADLCNIMISRGKKSKKKGKKKRKK